MRSPHDPYAAARIVGVPIAAAAAPIAPSCRAKLIGALAILVSPRALAAAPHGATYGTVVVNGLHIAYREAGNPANPKRVLLHGYPASSHQYRDLPPALADQFHVIAR